MQSEALRGVEERERLRPFRKENYRVKRAAGFACGECGAGRQVLVVELDGELTTRCQRHLAGTVRPGQWVDR